jgi:aerobic-type carbon monoxide dehydrogenase small subunit (CoxS/CutS family)
MTGMRRRIAVTVNGRTFTREVEPRLLLADFLRRECGLTGTHIGCAHGVCGACTVLVEGVSARSCLMFAVQADGRSVETVEGLATDDALDTLQQAFHESHALQCGYCTPGMLMSLTEFLRENPDPDVAAIRARVSGNLCRCTGYANIVKAVRLAATRLAAGGERSGGLPGGREEKAE